MTFLWGKIKNFCLNYRNYVAVGIISWLIGAFPNWYPIIKDAIAYFFQGDFITRFTTFLGPTMPKWP
jgi:hypothetical protein